MNRANTKLFVSERERYTMFVVCLLYTSDAADERSSVDLGGRRIIKKKKKEESVTTRNMTQIKHINHMTLHTPNMKDE